jgi:flagellar hook-associated protein 2
MSQVTISGAVSGVDTASIINSLVSLQGNQQTLLRSRQTSVQKTADAFGALITSLGSLSTQAKKVADTGAWVGLTATSSSSTVSVRASGTTPAALTFDVTALAARHAVVSAEAAGSTASVVASGPLVLTRSDGTATTIEVGDGTLDDVVTAINAAKAGVVATAVQTAPGQYRLQVAASSSGSTSAFTLDGVDGFSAMNVLQQGSDATIHVGDTLTGFDVTSASNTFTGVVPGLSFTVGKVETGVTVSSSLDGSGVAADISALVDTANKVLADIASKSGWDATTKTGGPLTGQSAVRTLAQSVLSAVGSAGAAGVSLTRDGRLSFDKQAFLDAFAADPSAVAGAYGASVAFAPASGVTGSIGLVRAGDTAKIGTYPVTVTAAPAREQWQLDPAGGTLAGSTVTLTRGDTTFSYTAPADETLADSVLALNARLSAAGFGVGASVSGSGVVFSAASAGSGAAFTASLDGNVGSQLAVGTDVAGTIDGVAASGSGNGLSLLSTTSSTSGAAGLTLSVDLSAADLVTSGGAVGSITYNQGLGQKLAALVADATASGGMLSAAKDGRDNVVKDLQKQIDSWDTRLETYRAMLSRQFTAMETAIATLKSQTSFLSSLSTGTSNASSSSSS